jgi:hypothetical protein
MSHASINHGPSQHHIASGNVHLPSNDLSNDIPSELRTLSAEELMAFVELQLGEIDKRIRERVATMNGDRARVEELNKAIGQIRSHTGGDSKIDASGLTDEQRLAAAQSARDCAASIEDPDAKAELENIANLIEAGASFSPEKAISTLEGKLQRITSNADTAMLHLQDDMQRRARVLTFVTNSLEALAKPQDRTVDNIG